MMMLSNLSRVRLFRLLHFCSLFFLAPAIFGQSADKSKFEGYLFAYFEGSSVFKLNDGTIKRIVMTTEGVQ